MLTRYNEAVRLVNMASNIMPNKTIKQQEWFDTLNRFKDHATKKLYKEPLYKDLQQAVAKVNEILDQIRDTNPPARIEFTPWTSSKHNSHVKIEFSICEEVLTVDGEE